jgi:hypothetical protein
MKKLLIGITDKEQTMHHRVKELQVKFNNWMSKEDEGDSDNLDELKKKVKLAKEALNKKTKEKNTYLKLWKECQVSL